MKAHVLVCVLGIAACGPSDEAPADAAIDAVTIDAGPCGADTFFTGELVDWDSTESNFLGVFEATYADATMPTRSDATSPNGRAELCVPTAAVDRIDVDAPDSYVDGQVIVRSDVVAAGGFYSARTMTAARMTSFFTDFSIPTTAGLGHLLVHVTGRQGGVTTTPTA